ncbi:MAG: type II toxin-antitoxin system RelE/ParE family toxin [Acidobacteria bacterium]|nr:type II toxin-antitoxin system RelE/ParE family toxin [Acidobacteriota bacterium]
MGNAEKESLTNQVSGEIFVRREAQLEVQKAFQYYQDKSEGLGFEFMRSLDAALQSVKRNPLAYQKIYKEARRILLRKFPYALFYIAEENRIVVIACFHQKRSEIDWLRRV